MEEHRSQFDDFSSGRIHRKEPPVETVAEDEADEDDSDKADWGGRASIVVPVAALFLPLILTASVALFWSYSNAIYTTFIVFPLAVLVCGGSTVISILKWAYLGNDAGVKLYRVGTFVGSLAILMLIVIGPVLASALNIAAIYSDPQTP